MPGPRRRGFTLIEMMVVIAIILVLIGLLLPAIGAVQRRASERRCQNNLRQIHLALQKYRDQDANNQDIFPYRVTWLYPEYIDNAQVFICPRDRSKGAEGGKPPSSTTQYAETDEPGTGPYDVPPGTKPLSYLYEFSGARCSWAPAAGGTVSDIGHPPQGWVKPAHYSLPVTYFETDGNPGFLSWAEIKWRQLYFGDWYLHADPVLSQKGLKGWPAATFPVLRCFWHMSNPNSNTEKQVLNQSFEGSTFWSAAHWEDTIR